MQLRPVIHAFERLRAQLPDKARVYVAGCSGEPGVLHAALQEAPELAAGLTFLGIWIPGINRLDWAGLHRDARAETIFLSPDLRASFAVGRTRLLPLCYTQAAHWLAETELHGAVGMFAAPDSRGLASLSVSADFTGIVMARGDVVRLGLINAQMPKVQDGHAARMGRLDETVEVDAPLVTTAPAILSPAFEALAGHIAGLIGDGDALQFGLGNVQQAVLGALGGHKRLRIHSGMITDPVIGLIEAGAVESERGAVTTGVAIGSEALYARAAGDPHFAFRPVPETHALPRLAAIDRFTAINSVIEVDLFGQANAEFINGRQVSGAGGLVDFLRGAAAAPGGRGILALTSTARAGKVSRIVPRLAPDATTIARADVQFVVTEHGIADLRLADIDARAEALITIAHPDFRASLAHEWDMMRRAM